MLRFLQPFLDRSLWEWIAKNRSTFILVILLLGNVYQYYDSSQRQSRYEESIKVANQKFYETNQNSLEYERTRSNTLEALLHDLVLKNNTLDSTVKALQEQQKKSKR